MRVYALGWYSGFIGPDSLIRRRQQQAGSVDDQRSSEDEQKNTRHKLITRGPTEHQSITSHLLVEVEQIGVVIPELVDLGRAVMEDDGGFFFTATANCVREVFSLGGKKLARVQVETR
jgi:hypothetical protein